jgi:DNA invertase Pin-like site-specific DNA recombinase
VFRVLLPARDRPDEAEAQRTYKGRPPTIQPDEVRRLKDEEKLGASEIATRLGIGRASVYRALKGTADRKSASGDRAGSRARGRG